MSSVEFIQTQNDFSYHKHMVTEKNQNDLELAKRLTIAIGSLGRGGKARIAETLGVSPQAVTNWIQRGAISKPNLSMVSNITGYNLQWLITGEGAPHAPNKQEPSESVRSYLDGILEACDRAMRSTGRTFTDAEKLDIYLEGIEFAGKKKFSGDLVSQYLKEMIKKSKM